MKIKTQNQKGAVSLFIVIFACLLVTIVTVGFVNVMIRNQQQVSDTDLSKSAYDSAMAGVEDAKRLMLEHLACLDSGSSSPDCAKVAQAIADQNCDTIQQGLGIGGPDEVLIRQNLGDEALDQAYTCVKIDFNTDDYVNEIAIGEGNLIPLRADGSFDRVKISWFKKDAGSSAMTLPTAPPAQLPAKADWTTEIPPILRAQIIQAGDNFLLSDFDRMTSTESNANTVFLYPSDTGATTVSFVSSDNRATDDRKTPVVIRCDQAQFAGGGYACSATLNLLDPIGGGSPENVFLRLGAIYNTTDYKVELYDGASTRVSFVGVQPEVDSTGRANALFRRVKARVEFTDSGFPYPQAAVELEGNLCKNFKVTDTSYQALTPACTP